MQSNKALWAGTVLSLLLSLTPFYGLGYLLFVIVMARSLRVVRAFDSYFSNFILSSLILACSIMIAGMFTSYMHIPNYAIINTLSALFFCGTILYFQPKDKVARNQTVFKFSDGVAIFTGLLIPVLALATHFTVLPSNVALFKLVNGDSWDNASHLNFLQVNSENKNYFYPTSPIQLDGKDLSNSYPQGWHLASSNIVDGFLPGALNPLNFGLSTTLSAYLIIVFAWYFIACFVLIKMVWSLLKPTRHKTMRSILVFIVAQIPILMLYLSCLNAGYVNYLGLIPLILIICLASYDMLKSPSAKSIWPYIVLSSLLAAGVCLTWPLPTPALILLILLTVTAVGLNFKNSTTAAYSRLLLSTALVLCASTIALYGLFLVQDIGADKLQVAPWPKSTVQAGIFTGIAITLLLSFAYKKNKHIILVLLPLLVTVLFFWLHAYLTAEGPGYYHAKILSLVLTVALTFGGAILVELTESFSINGIQKSAANLFKIAFVLSSVALVLLASGQHIDMTIFRPNKNILSSTELSYVADWMYSQDSLNNREQLLIARGNIRDNPNGTLLFNHTSPNGAVQFLTGSHENKYTCLQYIYYSKEGRALNKAKVSDSLSSCLKIRGQAGLHTKILLRHSARSVYDKINTYNAQFAYY